MSCEVEIRGLGLNGQISLLYAIGIDYSQAYSAPEISQRSIWQITIPDVLGGWCLLLRRSTSRFAKPKETVTPFGRRSGTGVPPSGSKGPPSVWGCGRIKVHTIALPPRAEEIIRDGACSAKFRLIPGQAALVHGRL